MQLFENFFKSAMRGDPVSIVFLALFVGVGLFALWHFLSFCFLMTKGKLESKPAKPEDDFPESEGRVSTKAEASGIRGLLTAKRDLLLLLFCFIFCADILWTGGSPRAVRTSYIFIFLGPIVLLMLVFYATSFALTGLCPYCGGGINAVPKNNEINCPSCKKRIIVRNRKFWTEGVSDNPE